MPRLSVDYTVYCQDVDKLVSLQSQVVTLRPEHSKLVAEIVLLRLFDLFQQCLESIACKIVCGAPYVDGMHPTLLRPAAHSRTAAERLMLSHGRSRPRHGTAWSKATEAKENVRYLINANDHFMTTLDHHGMFIDEMRRVRNRIAHNSKNARHEYREVVRRYYGAYLNSIAPGTLLMSPRQAPGLIDQYLVKSKILVKELVKA
jgi:hypothetical protein